VSDPHWPLARLMAMAYRSLVDDLHSALRDRGWSDVRPSFGFVLLAAREQPVTATELAALMETTKQAASRLAGDMVDAGYLVQVAGEADARRRPLTLSARGRRLLRDVEAIYRDVEAGWAEQIGERALERMRRDLTTALMSRHGGALPAVRPPI
jgi:DNA-binding MarR family transcriptional regulator